MGFQHMERGAVQALGSRTGGLNRKLSDDQVKAIREHTGKITDAEFADDFKVDVQTVTKCRVGMSYKAHPSAPRRVYARKVAA